MHSIPICRGRDHICSADRTSGTRRALPKRDADALQEFGNEHTLVRHAAAIRLLHSDRACAACGQVSGFRVKGVRRIGNDDNACREFRVQLREKTSRDSHPSPTRPRKSPSHPHAAPCRAATPTRFRSSATSTPSCVTPRPSGCFTVIVVRGIVRDPPAQGQRFCRSATTTSVPYEAGLRCCSRRAVQSERSTPQDGDRNMILPDLSPLFPNPISAK